MRIEKYYYTESLAKLQTETREMWAKLRGELDILQGESEEEKKEREQKAIADMIPLTKQNVSFDSRKYALFKALAKFSVSVAREMTANLLVYTEFDSGWIIFVGTSLYAENSYKDRLVKMLRVTDGMRISASMDTGQGDPTDIDDAIQLAFRFDFYITETEE